MTKVMRFEASHVYVSEEPIDIKVSQELKISSKDEYGDEVFYDKPTFEYETSLGINTMRRKPREMTLIETLCVLGCSYVEANKICRCVKYGDKIPRKYRRKYRKTLKAYDL